MIFFCFRFQVVLFDRPGILICHTARCILARSCFFIVLRRDLCVYRDGSPISLGCDEFAMGLRIDSLNRHELSRNVRMVSQSPRMHRELVANGSPKFYTSHVILLCATKIIAKPSPKHRICREPVANPSQTFANTSQGSFRDLHNATNMRHK